MYFISMDNIKNPLIHEVKICGARSLIADFTADGRYVLITGNNRYIHFFDILENHLEKIHNIPEMNESCWNMFQCSPCGKIAVLRGSNGKLMILSLVTRRCIKIIRTNASVTCFTISSDGLLLLATDEDQSLYVWSLEDFECIKKHSLDAGNKLTSLALSSDQMHLSVG